MGDETVDETVCGETRLVLGMFNNKSVGFASVAAREPRGDGERERRERGEAKPLEVRPGSRAELAGATMAIWSIVLRSSVEDGVSSSVARMAAALSSTLGTACSSCSVLRARGMRCGFEVAEGDVGLWRDVEEGESIGSMSRSKMADEDEWTLVGLLGIELGDPTRSMTLAPATRRF